MYKRFLTLLLLLLLIVPLAHAQKKFQPVSDTALIVDSIEISGNKITKERIILRELEMKTGDTLYPHDLAQKIKQSRENLLNQSLFNFVDITTTRYDFNKIKLLVKVTERWYIWPVPILTYADRNFNIWWKNKDFKRTNFGIDLTIYNFRGRKERLDFIFQEGYDKTLSLEWHIPYINYAQKWGLVLSGGLVYNHETDYGLHNSKKLYYREDDQFVRKQYFAKIGATYRPKYRITHTFYLCFYQDRFADSLQILNPTFAYGPNRYSYFTLEYNFKLDYRDYAPYPLRGYYFEFNALKEGLNLLDKKVNLFSFYLVFDQYFKLSKRWFFAYNISSKVVTNRYQPYFLQKGLGFLPMTIRGYQLHIVNGQQIALMRSNLKFELIPKKVMHIPFIKSNKFGKIFYAIYANLFFDAGYVADRQSPVPPSLNNKLLYSTGIGLDIVSYYDVVLRLEYSINRQKEKGFFISFIAPI